MRLVLAVPLAAALAGAALAAPARAVVPCSAVMPPRQVDQARQTVVNDLPPEAQAALAQAVQTVC
jgi:hypothetical protein